MLQNLPISKDKLFVWAFIPYKIQGEELVSEDYDTPACRQELGYVFAELGLAWKWQPITLENMQTVVEEVVASSSEYIPIVLNYCDGNEIDGFPGISVIKLLESKGIIFTGSDYQFFDISSSKISMKQAFLQSGVSTAPYEVISDDIEGVCDRLGTPLLVKPAHGYGSIGISLESVVESDEQVSKQFWRLLQGLRDIQFPPDGIFVERFISGREFTVFLLGDSQQPETLKIYPPIELVFHSNLPETEQFRSYENFYGEHIEESSSPSSEPFFYCQQVASNLSERLCDLSKRAYCAVGGNGYARVDIRMDKDSQELFVLEVNANCGISSTPLTDFSDLNQTSLGTILHLANIPFAQLMSEIIAEAFARDSEKLASVNQLRPSLSGSK
jgi:D-alanine-D-alanine ligase